MAFKFTTSAGYLPVTGNSTTSSVTASGATVSISIPAASYTMSNSAFTVGTFTGTMSTGGVSQNISSSYSNSLVGTFGATNATLNTSNLFNANNKTSKTVSVTTIFTKIHLKASAPSSGSSGIAFDGDMSIVSNLRNTCTITLNAPPIFDSTDVSFDTPYVYAGYTTASVTVSSLSAKYGGDISSAILKIGNATSSSRTTDGTLSLALTEAGTFTPQVIVTDSRGQTTTKNLTQITVLPYVLPSTSFSVIRASSTGEAEDEGKSAVITATYNFTSAVASLSAPAIGVKDQSGITVSPTVTWYANRALTTPISDWSTVLTGSTVYALLDNANHNLFNTQYSYPISLTPNDIDVNSDTHSGTTITRILGSAFYTMDFLAGGHGIAFGKAATNEVFECDMETTFNRNVNMADYSGFIRNMFNLLHPKGSYYETDLPYIVPSNNHSYDANNLTDEDKEACGDTWFDPRVMWGGTWELEAEGGVHISAGSNYTAGYSYGSNSKSYTPTGSITVNNHTLGVAEIPGHTHGSRALTGSMRVMAWSNATASGIISMSNQAKNKNPSSGSNEGAATFTVTATHTHDNVGSTGGHNHTGSFKGTQASINVMQQSIAIYRWHRTL